VEGVVRALEPASSFQRVGAELQPRQAVGLHGCGDLPPRFLRSSTKRPPRIGALRHEVADPRLDGALERLHAGRVWRRDGPPVGTQYALRARMEHAEVHSHLALAPNVVPAALEIHDANDVVIAQATRSPVLAEAVRPEQWGQVGCGY